METVPALERPKTSGSETLAKSWLPLLSIYPCELTSQFERVFRIAYARYEGAYPKLESTDSPSTATLIASDILWYIPHIVQNCMAELEGLMEGCDWVVGCRYIAMARVWPRVLKLVSDVARTVSTEHGVSARYQYSYVVDCILAEQLQRFRVLWGSPENHSGVLLKEYDEVIAMIKAEAKEQVIYFVTH